MEPIPEPGDDAFKDGALNKRYMARIVKRANRLLEFVMPPGSQKPSVMATDEKIIADFSHTNFGGSGVALIPLSLHGAASTNNDTQPNIRVIYGHVDGVRADASMAGGVSMVVPVANAYKIWLQFPVAFDDAINLWTRTGTSSIFKGTTLAVSTNSLAVFTLGVVTVENNAVTHIGSVSPGYLSWKRCGPEDNFVDDFRGAGA